MILSIVLSTNILLLISGGSCNAAADKEAELV